MANVNEKMGRVLQGFASLDTEERREVYKAIKEYQENIDHKFRKELLESFSEKAGISLGPTGQGGCPCCGK
jgi:hypothetical protein